MGSLDEEEAILKKKLEGVEDLDERREIRRQLREVRNRKFEEEMKKISSGNYDVSSSLLTDLTTKSKEIKSKEIKTGTSDEYGLSRFTDVDALQQLLDETPSTEPDKRRKIRGRIREIKNGNIGTPIAESTMSPSIIEKGTVANSSQHSLRETSGESKIDTAESH